MTRFIFTESMVEEADARCNEIFGDIEQFNNETPCSSVNPPLWKLWVLYNYSSKRELNENITEREVVILLSTEFIAIDYFMASAEARFTTKH